MTLVWMAVAMILFVGAVVFCLFWAGRDEEEADEAWDVLDLAPRTDAELLLMFDTQAPSDSRVLRFHVMQSPAKDAAGQEVRH